MLKRFAPILLFNILMALVFVFANISFWQHDLNGNLAMDSNNPLQIGYIRISYSNDLGNYLNAPTGPLTQLVNYPYILFWISTIGNVCLAAILLRSKETKTT